MEEGNDLEEKVSKQSSFTSIFRKKHGFSSRAVRAFETNESDSLTSPQAENDQSHNWMTTKVNVETDGGDLKVSTNKSRISFVDARQDTQLERLRTPFQVLKEGWLFKKNSSRTKMNKWSKRWFILSEDSLYYVRGGLSAKDMRSGNHKKVSTKKICNLMLATVREYEPRGKFDKYPKPKYRFEIITSEGRSVMLQSVNGDTDYIAWIEMLRARTYQLLMNEGDAANDEGDQTEDESADEGDEAQRTPQEKLDTIWASVKNGGKPQLTGDDMSDCNLSDTNTQYTDASGSVITTFNHYYGQDNLLQSNDQENDAEDVASNILRQNFENMKRPKKSTRCPASMINKILKKNPYCADCGQAGPDWASINTGVLLCIDCSGVHRSLGVHISKVRSLRQIVRRTWV